MIDCKTPKIAMLVNPIKEILKVTKGIQLDIIYKYINIVYIMINMLKVLTILTAIAVTASTIDLFISI